MLLMMTVSRIRRPLQNRVDPFGTIHAVASRGTLMGNRGGRLHNPDTKELLKQRKWASKAWISCCLTSHKGIRREVMGNNSYTELFFLDEVTALAAGHRPCFHCRRSDAKAFQNAWQEAQNLPKTPKVTEMDPILHDERLRQDRYVIPRDDLVTGTMILHDDKPLAIKQNLLLEWSFEGYKVSTVGILDLPSTVVCLTPPSIVAVLGCGYEPKWHESSSTHTLS